MPQMTEQEKSPKKELNEVESSNLLDIEFKTVVIGMLKELRRRMDEINKN